jgi:DNA-binding GntR family transcriptional regulator
MVLEIRTISDRLVDIIRDRILSGEIPPSVAIRQDSLAAELQISKIPLREALARLEQDGLLVSHPNRGFFVRALSTREAEEVFALRLKIGTDPRRVKKLLFAHLEHTLKDLRIQLAEESASQVDEPGKSLAKQRPSGHGTLRRKRRQRNAGETLHKF